VHHQDLHRLDIPERVRVSYKLRLLVYRCRSQYKAPVYFVRLPVAQIAAHAAAVDV